MNKTQKEIFRQIFDRITNGQYEPGALLPTEQQLCDEFSVSRHHVHVAMKEFEQLSLIVSNKKGGTRLKRLPYAYETQGIHRLFKRKVCVLNSCPRAFRHISWNDRIFHALKTAFDHAEVELEVRICDSMQDHPDAYAAEIRSIAESGVSAIILIPENTIRYQVFSEMLFRCHDNIFVFERGSVPHDSSVYNVIGINNFADGVIAAEAAIRQGAKRLIFALHVSLEGSWITARYRGASMGAFRMSGGGIRVEYFVRGIHGDFPLDASSPDTAIIACHDEAAAQLIQAGCARHLYPMRDYKIIGFGDDARFENFKLTTLSPNLELIGETLAARIISSLDPITSPSSTYHQIASTLIRRSTL